MADDDLEFGSSGLGELLRKDRLRVPLNQRSYKWEDRHVNDLFQDLAGSFGNKEESYFLGAIVLLASDDGDPWIADGQQRLATTTILLARIRDYQTGLGRSARADSVDMEYLRSIDPVSEQRVSRLKLNADDHDFFERVILSPRSAKELKRIQQGHGIQAASNRRLQRASEIAQDFVSSLLSPYRQDQHSDYLVRWVDYLRRKAKVVVVTVPDEVSAYRIFETLNDRGMRASQADLLKNYFFSRSGKRLHDASAMWSAMTSVVEAASDDEGERLVTYLRHLWITQKGPTKERELAGAIREEITNEVDTLQFLAEAKTAAQDYVAVGMPGHEKWNEYRSSVRKSLQAINDHLRVEQIRPLMFAVARRFEPAEVEKAFRLFVSWSIRFMIVGGRGGLLDRQYALRAQEVGTGRTTKARELRDAMREYVPTDPEFEQAFAAARFTKSFIARYCLRALNNTLNEDPEPEFVPNEDESEVNLEHVMPVEPGPEWQMSAEDGAAAYNQLGNMVLLRASKNRRLGNSGYKKKQATYAASGYAITKQAAGYDDWGIEQIRARQAEMAKLAVRTWRLTFGD